MKILVNVYVEAIRKTGLVSFRSKVFEVEPFMVTRYETGKGTKRYYYTAHFIGFGEMITVLEKSAVGEQLYSGINRVINRRWKPPKEGWVANKLMLYDIESRPSS